MFVFYRSVASIMAEANFAKTKKDMMNIAVFVLKEGTFFAVNKMIATMDFVR